MANDLLKFFVAMMFDVFAYLLRGCVASQVWFWFLVPIGVQEIDRITATGLCLTAGAIFGAGSGKDAGKLTTGQFATMCIMQILAPLVCLVTAWLIHAFFM